MNEAEDQISAYVEGRMDAAEQASFETRMANDPNLADAVALHQEATAAVQAVAREALKNRIQSLDEKAPSSNARLWIGIAASVALLVVATWWWSSNSSAPPSELYATYYENYPDRLSTLSSSDALLKKAMAFYQNQQFDSSIVYLLQLKPTFQPPEAIDLYLGLSELGAKRPEKALLYFHSVKDQQAAFAEVAHWYEVLALLANQKNDAALASLQAYRKQWTYQAEKAAALEKDLQ
ncbi:MAG: hypothetical protein ACFB10_05105 [Salibacteraceae bacterium]